MKINLNESQQWSGASRVDRENCLIRDVKIVGLESANGNDYTLEALRKSRHLYEGRKVNLNHRKRSEKGEDRSIIDRFGRMQDVRVGDDGSYGNLKYNPKHPLAESILWFAEFDPEAIGLSQFAVGEGRKKPNGRYQVESITSVMSIDLVADPATTKSLYESKEPDMAEAVDAAPAVETAADHNAQMQDAFANGVMAVVKDGKLDLQGKIKRIKEILQAQEKLLGTSKDEPEAADDAEGEAPVQESTQPDQELVLLRREKNVRLLCESAKYTPDQAMLDVLTAVTDEGKVKALILKEAAKAQALGKAKAPRSAAPVAMRESAGLPVPAGARDGKEIATALRRFK